MAIAEPLTHYFDAGAGPHRTRLGQMRAPKQGLAQFGSRRRHVGESRPRTWNTREMEQKIFDELNERVRQIFAQSPAADIEKNLRAMLATLFARLDLVTREEFDVQREVLLRTREKLKRIEAQVAELERRLDSTSQTSHPQYPTT
jgi:BMFP domain-containing protein YqiC